MVRKESFLLLKRYIWPFESLTISSLAATLPILPNGKSIQQQLRKAANKNKQTRREAQIGTVLRPILLKGDVPAQHAGNRRHNLRHVRSFDQAFAKFYHALFSSPLSAETPNWHWSMEITIITSGF